MSFAKYGTIEKEKSLPYKLADYFAFTRQFINRKRLFWVIFWVDVYSIIGGIVIWVVWYASDMEYWMNSQGEHNGVYVYGVYMTLSVVIIHHLQVAFNVRNWTWWITMWFIILFIILVPLAFWLSQLGANSKLQKSTFTMVWSQPKFWLLVMLCVVLLYGGLYFIKRWQAVVKYSQFYKA